MRGEHNLLLKDGKPRFIKSKNFKIPVGLGYCRGLAVCTAIEAFGDKFFRLDEHVKRLINSSAEAEIPIHDIGGFDKLPIYLKKLVEKCGFTESVVYVYIDRGEEEDNKIPFGEPFVWAKVYKEHRHAEPMAITTERVLQRALPRIKSTDYLAGRVAWERAGRPDEVLFLDKYTGEILEAMMMNVMLLKNDRQLFIPRLDSGKILHGITAKTILQILRGEIRFEPTKSIRVPFIEESSLVRFEDFGGKLTGVILASTTGVVPVRSIDGREVHISQMTKDICKLFEEYRTWYYKNYAIKK